ncbi:MAG TPA: hypothetical protein VFS49_07980 [Croceibacterium sp.]|nr:hypothetical protein [Croceibacterium sp.]
MFESRHDRAGSRVRALAVAIALAALAAPGAAQQPLAATPAGATYADIADLAESAAVVALVEVRNQAEVEAERAPGLAPGHARLYLEARTEALLAGRAAVGESLVYLVDVPLDSKGKAPKLRKQRFLVFADPVAGRPGSLQLVDPSAQLAATPANEQLTRNVIAALAAPDAPPAVTGIRDVMSVPGNLAGESETQLFLDTESGEPVSLSVVRRPGMEPEWGVSWSEIVDQSARPPEPQTVAWYRLACSLPAQLPAGVFLQQDQPSRRRAEADYEFIVGQLGDCPRTRM